MMSKDGMVGKKSSRGKEPMTSVGDEYQVVEQYISTRSLLWLYEDNVKSYLSKEDLMDFRKMKAHPRPGVKNRSKNDSRRLGLLTKNYDVTLNLFDHMMNFQGNVNVLMPIELSSKCVTGESVIAMDMANITLRDYLQDNKEKIFFSHDKNIIHEFSPFFIDLIRGVGKGLDGIHQKGFTVGNLSLDSILLLYRENVEELLIPKIVVNEIHPHTEAGVAIDVTAICSILQYALQIGVCSNSPLPIGHESLDVVEKINNNTLKSVMEILAHPGLWKPLEKIDYLLEFLTWYGDKESIKKKVHQDLAPHLPKSKTEKEGSRVRKHVGGKAENYMRELRNLIHHLKKRNLDHTNVEDPSSIYMTVQAYRKDCPHLMVILVEYGNKLGLQHLIQKV